MQMCNDVMWWLPMQKAEQNECLKIQMDTAVEQEHLRPSAIQLLSFENVWSQF